jgi:hypothetical protein
VPSSSETSSPRVDAWKIGCDIINMGGEGRKELEQLSTVDWREAFA